jgi:phage N-6-adenine-methyltransferase
LQTEKTGEYILKDITTKKESNIQQFNPEQTVTEIAQLEGIERMCKKAKNAEKLCEAIEEKLERQRDFVVWWDAQDKLAGARGDRTVTPLKEYGVDKKTVSRWRDRLVKRDFLNYKKVAIDKALRACEGKGSPFAELHGNKNNDWYTPKLYIDLAREVMGGIDLDPATSAFAQETVGAKTFYTVDDDGLSKEWAGRVWINPPFSNVLPFADKLISHLEVGDVTQAIVLTNNNTDTVWWHKMAELANGVCFTKGRISFYDTFGNTSAPTNGQCFFYFGEKLQLFTDCFYPHGLIR